MTSTGPGRRNRRRLLMVAAGTLVVASVAAVAPTPVLGAAPASATAVTATTSTVVRASSLSRTAAATVVPFRFGTVGYSQWWARKLMYTKYRWGSTAQYKCIVVLWNHESHWNYRAHNRRSGAHGIPQAQPGSKMRGAGRDWYTNPVTQIVWGLGYIAHRYGSPCMALTHYNHHRWY